MIDGNLMENNWAAAQTGYAILLKSEFLLGIIPTSLLSALTDGSVRFLAETIDLNVYHALGSRDGGEPVGSF